MKDRKHGGGRPSQYKDTEQGMMNFVEDSKNYAMVLRNSTKTFSYGAWASHLGITRQTLYNYMNRSEAWKDAILQCEEMMVKGA